jgi:hypothetical protein
VNVRQNTYSNLFHKENKNGSNENDTTTSMINVLKRTNSSKRVYNYLKNDSMSGIISYQYAPTFRIQVNENIFYFNYFIEIDR